jgi:hypothetical protein
MAHETIKDFLAQLRQKLPYVPPVSAGTLQSLHQAKNYKGMVQQIKKFMNIEGVKIRVEWVPDGAANDESRKDAPAWINLPDKMPSYGTKAFKEMTLRMCIRRPFLRQSTYDQAAITIAHELSHLVLDSIAHPLCREEKAVDLTAMLLGFRLLYKSGCYKEWRSGNNIFRHTVGYLSREEVDFVNDLLSETANGERSSVPSRWKFPLSLQTIVALHPFIISALVALAVVILTYRTPEPPHETRTADQTPAPPSLNPAPPPIALPDEPFQRPRPEVDYATLQRRLIELGYYVGPADGVWGRKSRSALRAFKVANGLPANEEYDDTTGWYLFSPRPARVPMPLGSSEPKQLWPSANAQ